MLIFAAFIALVTSAHRGSLSYDECMSMDFEPKVCWESEQLYKAGRYLCEKQGKPYSGKSDCSG